MNDEPYSQLVKEQKTHERPRNFLKDLRILVHVLEIGWVGGWPKQSYTRLWCTAHKPNIRNLGRLPWVIVTVTLHTSPRGFPASLKQEPWMLFVLMTADAACALPLTLGTGHHSVCQSNLLPAPTIFHLRVSSRSASAALSYWHLNGRKKSLNFLALLWWNDPEVCSLLLSIVPQWYQQPPPPPSIDRANPLNNIFLGHPKINYLLTGVGWTPGPGLVER